MMIGRGTCRAISRTIFSLNAPVAVDSPISAVGRTAAITSAKLAGSAPPGPLPPLSVAGTVTARAGWANWRCAGLRSVRSAAISPRTSAT